MRKVLINTIIAVGILVLGATVVSAEEQTENAQADSIGTEQVVVYYLHMNRRCATCQKLEAYSQEAVKTGFADQLKDSSIVFHVENFEQEGNQHFAKQYQLFSQSVILSRQVDGKETDWKNLDKIWQLVGNKQEFVDYVQAEVTRFVKNEEEEIEK